MAYKAPGQLQVVRMRVCRLDAAGAPIVGAGNLYVSKALALIAARVDISAGDDFEQKNGGGEVCVSYRDDDKLKGLLFDLQLCTPDPELVQIMQGGALFKDPDDLNTTRGYGYPKVDGSDRNDFGVGIEAWCKAITNGAQDSEFPHWRYVFGGTEWWPGDKTLENAPAMALLSGKGRENPGYGNGPLNDIPDWVDTSRVCDYYLDPDAPPNAVAGAQATPAHVE